jgi:hypothetical protein
MIVGAIVLLVIVTLYGVVDMLKQINRLPDEESND